MGRQVNGYLRHLQATEKHQKLEIRSVERGICPIAMLYSLAAAYKGGRCNQGAIIFHGS